MNHLEEFYINGAWVAPKGSARIDVIDPSTEKPFTKIALGTVEDVDIAVAAAKEAFKTFSKTSLSFRVDLLKRITELYNARKDDFAEALHQEMGAPIKLGRDAQVYLGSAHLAKINEVLPHYEFTRKNGHFDVTREPIGVCALITPWNWPLNQIIAKVAPAIAAGCTMVLKPSEIAPLNAIICAEIFHEAGVPAGVFNMVHGEGPVVGEALATHKDVDMVSFTGSTRAGVRVAQVAAPTVKRVSQELGGKSPNIILDDADFDEAVRKGVLASYLNSGQSCDAPTRMLVPASKHQRAIEVAAETAAGVKVVPGRDSDLGPVVSEAQYNKIQGLIQAGIDEGAQLVAGGPGRPDGIETGYFVRPTVFAGVKPKMRIAQEEIFGPVLSILPYETEEEAIAIANDTVYGLAAYVQTSDPARGERVARAIRAGKVVLNYAPWNSDAPFGGYRQSGNGREYAEFGLEDFLEIKSIIRSAAT